MRRLVQQRLAKRVLARTDNRGWQAPLLASLLSGTAAAIAIAPAMIAYSAAIVSNARLVERRVKRDILVPPSVNELVSKMVTGTACKS